MTSSSAHRFGEATSLEPADWAWLDRVVADWQILADLSFADLVLWVPDKRQSGFWAADQIRPTTGPTTVSTDVVGTRSALPPDEAIPVRREGRIIAVIGRYSGSRSKGPLSPLEQAYLQAADELSQMLSSGVPLQTDVGGGHTDSPRVGDGLIRLDATGTVQYASPNAQSAFRKLGLSADLVGQVLVDVTRDLVPAELRDDEEILSAVLAGRRAGEIEFGNVGATLVARSIPLAQAGALVLVRDVTDLRRRDRELITKDATIREIHHRVKNNLQTVAALLRLQARRLENPEGRAALEEAIRRVAAIAVVHETLSQSYDEAVAFDEVADQLARSISDVGGHGGAVTVRREGSFGTLSSALATPLALVLTELVQNAVEHGYPGDDGGQIVVRSVRSDDVLTVSVVDDGVGVPPGFDAEESASLGLSIVRTLVAEMEGSLRFEALPRGGAEVSVRLPV